MSGTIISTKDTLPAAVDYEDPKALCSLPYAALHGLLTDCRSWCSWMDDLRAGLETAAGRTEWDVMMRVEQEDVVAAQGRVLHEIEARSARLTRSLSESLQSGPGVPTGHLL